MLYHFVPLTWLNRGTFGVLLFFIISGYCISFSVETSESAWHFYAKRLGRLLPALVVCGFATTLLKHVAPGLIEPDRQVSWFNYVKTLVYIPTLNPARDSYRWPDGAYWSLVVEFEFYALCLLAMIAGLKHRLLTILCVLLVFRTLVDDNTHNDFFSFFVAGMGVALIVRGRKRAGMAGIAVAFMVEFYGQWVGIKQPSVPLETYRSVLLCLGTLAVFLAARFDHYLPHVARVFAYVGVISYPLYLIHQDVGNMLLKLVNVGVSSWPDILVRAFVLPPLLGFVAWLVHDFVERRAIKPMTRALVGWR